MTRFAPEATSPSPAESPWCRTFPATLDQVRQARRFVATILDGSPAADAAITCVSELAANAIAHSRSALPGGTFTVRLHRAGAAIRVEVQDEGGPWHQRLTGPEHGRGLKVVRALSSRRDITVTGPRHNPTLRVVAFEIDPP